MLVVPLFVSQLAALNNIIELVPAKREHHVFRLEVSVDDVAHPVQVVQTEEDLAGNDADQGQRHPAVVVTLDYFQQIDPQDLEHHNKMLPVGPEVHERVQQLDAVTTVDIRLPLVLRQNYAQKRYRYPRGVL